MRLVFAASVLCLSLSVFDVASADSPTPAPSTSAPAAGTPGANAPSGNSSPLAADAAAAKHAKRTACLKDAKSKKLVGADKSAFLKDCMDAP
jgi:hypothetical protein